MRDAEAPRSPEDEELEPTFGRWLALIDGR